MKDVINGKVAAIIDDTTLVLNVGYQAGVEEGMTFAIFAEFQEIADPDSGATLGKWEMVKARVVADHVQEHMCTVRTPLVAEQDRPGTLSAMMVQHSFGHYGQRSEERERLEVRTADGSGRPQSQPVVVGDQARSLPPKEGGGHSTEPASEAHKTGESAEKVASPEGPDAQRSEDVAQKDSE